VAEEGLDACLLVRHEPPGHDLGQARQRPVLAGAHHPDPIAAVAR
jgi:hypothetical protein